MSNIVVVLLFAVGYKAATGEELLADPRALVAVCVATVLDIVEVIDTVKWWK